MAPLARRTDAPHCAVHINRDVVSSAIPARSRVNAQFVRALRRKLWLQLEAQERLDEEQDGDGEDPDGECLLSKVLALAMTLAVGGFIYFVVLQRFYHVRPSQH